MRKQTIVAALVVCLSVIWSMPTTSQAGMNFDFDVTYPMASMPFSSPDEVSAYHLFIFGGIHTNSNTKWRPKRVYLATTRLCPAGVPTYRKGAAFHSCF